MLTPDAPRHAPSPSAPLQGDTAGPVTLNLGCVPGGVQKVDGSLKCVMPEDSNATVRAVVVAVQVLLCIDLLFTLPILLAAAREIIENGILSVLPKDINEGSIRNATRASLVFLIAAVSYAVPDFSSILRFLGGLFQSLVAFVIPPAIFNRLHKDEMGGLQYYANAVIIAFGLVMSFISVVTIFVPL